MLEGQTKVVPDFYCGHPHLLLRSPDPYSHCVVHSPAQQPQLHLGQKRPTEAGWHSCRILHRFGLHRRHHGGPRWDSDVRRGLLLLRWTEPRRKASSQTSKADGQADGQTNTSAEGQHPEKQQQQQQRTLLTEVTGRRPGLPKGQTAGHGICQHFLHWKTLRCWSVKWFAWFLHTVNIILALCECRQDVLAVFNSSVCFFSLFFLLLQVLFTPITDCAWQLYSEVKQHEGFNFRAVNSKM